MSNHPKWEYKTIKFDAKGVFGGVADIQALDAALNALGEQSWELVSIFDTNMQFHGRTREIVATLKRVRD